MLSPFQRPAPSAGKNLPQLDALRGVAILAVFAQHLGDRFLPLVRRSIENHAPPSLVPWVLTVLHHAWWGVDLFFVLSGFSLSLSWLRAGAQAPKAFLLRRAARILPGYYLALVLTLAFHHELVQREAFAPAMFAHLFVLQGYISPGGIILIGASWSLTTEVSFYILFPWLERLVSSPKRRLLLLACALVPLSWLVRAALHEIVLQPGVLTGLLESTQRRWLPSRLDQFLLGALAARLFLHLESMKRAIQMAPLGLGLCIPALICAFKLEGAYYLEPWGSFPYAFLSLVTAAIVLCSSLCRGQILKYITPRPLVFTGIVSYGVFLYHQLALGLCDLDRASPPTWINLARTAGLALCFSLFMGYLSWIFVEQPAMKWVGRLSGKSSRLPRN